MGQPDWYRYGWSLDMKNQSWTEDTMNQVDFILNLLELSGNERILDLACGYGRHSLELARRGFCVTGVDITKELIEDAKHTANAEALDADFLQCDIRDVSFVDEFDVVLNLADGAIGYLENDEENMKIFDIATKALRPNGKHLIDICNADHAEIFFPKKHWEKGNRALALAQFEWDSITRRMKYGSWNIPYGEVARPPKIEMDEENSTRLYSYSELDEIYKGNL